MKFDLIVSDPPWSFSDKLKNSKVKRGASSNYKVLRDKDIVQLSVKDIAADNSVLCLWVPSSKLDIGLECMKNWGFAQKQVWVWVKTKNNPLHDLKPSGWLRKNTKIRPANLDPDTILGMINSFNMNSTLAFGMGRIARNCHELVLVGTRGKVYKNLLNKSQRTVFFGPVTKHSEKPETLQDMLDIMFAGKKCEMFARRDRLDWTCVGLECLSTKGELIHQSIERLSKL